MQCIHVWQYYNLYIPYTGGKKQIKLDLVEKNIFFSDRQPKVQSKTWSTAETKSTRFKSKSMGKWPSEQSLQNSLYSRDLASKIDLVIFTVMHSSPLRNCCLQLDVSAWLSGTSEEYLSRSHSLSVSSSCVSQGRAGVGGKTPQCHQLHTRKPRYLNKAL